MSTATANSSMVSSSDVNGTDVYNRKGEKLGHIDHLMIDKQSGKVAYAVMHFGGFLGMGEETHPVPWSKLDYDVNKAGFVSDIDKSTLEGAPRKTDDWHRDRTWEEATFNYYGVPPYWI